MFKLNVHVFVNVVLFCIDFHNLINYYLTNHHIKNNLLSHPWTLLGTMGRGGSCRPSRDALPHPAF